MLSRLMREVRSIHAPVPQWLPRLSVLNDSATSGALPPRIDLMILSSSMPPTLLIVTFGCAVWNRWSALVKIPSSRPVKPLHTVRVTGALELSAFDALLLEELQAATALAATHKIASCFLICPPGAQRVGACQMCPAVTPSGSASRPVGWCERTRPGGRREALWRRRLAGRRHRRARSRRCAAASGASRAAPA